MKRIGRRACAALILSVLILAGMAVYLVRFVTDGAQWAGAAPTAAGGTASLTDRNGELLLIADDGTYTYSQDTAVRRACLHAVGDRAGFIGTGILSARADILSGYSLLTGVYNADSGDATASLTLDSSLNVTALNALAGRPGSVLVTNYKTGELLCMVSSPTYDPDVGFNDSDPAYDGAYLNRCISSTLAPGSVFKLVTFAAAIENIPDLYGRSFYCEGGVEIGGVYVKCTGTHGQQTVEQALAHSCNCAAADLSLELGADVLAQYVDDLGLTSEHGLNGIVTAAGSFEKAEAGSAELAWSGIGQSKDLVSPYSMLRLVAAIANGGTVVEPTLITGERNGRTALLKSDTADRLAEMMSYNVSWYYGSGNFPGLALAAKSGSAETGDGSSHAWFVGFLNDDEHPYAFVVVVEKGGSGREAAGAVANTVLQQAVSTIS